MEKKVTGKNANIVNMIDAILYSNEDDFKKRIGSLKEYIESISNSGKNREEMKNYGDIEYLRDIMVKVDRSRTVERKKHYLMNARKSISEIRTNGVNDINLNRWKDYQDIITDSLWIIPKRSREGGHLGWYWGNFIPQIPSQIMLRYSKKGSWVIDPFMGSGTTLIEAIRLGRNAVGIEINEKIADKAREYVGNIGESSGSHYEIITGNSLNLDYTSMMERLRIKSFDLAIVHPPYHDIIKFSDDPEDLSNAPSTDNFLERMEELAATLFSILKRRGYLALVIGDKYERGELFPLGFRTMESFLGAGFRLKSIVVKNFEFTRGKSGQDELWRYRALVGGYYVFKHEYIMIFEK